MTTVELLFGNGNKVELSIYEMNDMLHNGFENSEKATEFLDWTNIGGYQIKKFIESVEQKAIKQR